MKRFFSIILSIILFAAVLPQISVSAAPPSLEDIGGDYYGLRMPFRPGDKYVSEQNSPDFTWPYAEEATYELKIAKNSEMTDVERNIVDIKTNYYTLSRPLSHTGIDYYWSVRYKTSAGTSAWSNPRRFRIDPDAGEFTVPSANELLKRIPSGHPRVFATCDTINEFRALKDKNEDAKKTYDYYISQAANYVAEDILPKEPKRGVQTMSEANTAAREIIRRMQTCAFAYLLTGKESYGRMGIKAAVELSKWDYKEESLNSYNMSKGNDQVHREIAYKSAMSYDWLYELMNESERKSVRDMIVGRLTYKYVDYPRMINLTESLPRAPFNSHGWTSIAYIGMIAYILKDDVPEASQWFMKSVPFYITMMPPWSYQDGGWCQGSSYWGWSTIESTKEISDVLLFGNVIDLYKKAVARNENLWTLYTYPHGSFGSFGDGSGGYLAENFSSVRESMYELACFNNDGLALWTAQQQGERSHCNVWDYYSADTNAEPTPPDNLPLGHCFKDVGWVVMTNDFKDPNRIHMTFKSSQYGSFNHSHADQNAFVIQAFGKELATHSGYYDSYNTPHDANITRQSFAHNTITINGGKGQPIHNINAKGNIEEFVNHIDFDSVTGRAADAYKKSLKRFDRNIIYLRPDVYAVIDDLEANDGQTAKFEWCLNSKSNFENIGGKQNSVLINDEEANLKTDIIYPNVTFSSNAEVDSETGKTVYKFKSPIDGIEYTPGHGYESRPVQRMMRFATEETDATKIVAIMSLYQDSGNEPEFTAENFGDYIKIVCRDKTLYANLKKSGEAITADGYNFDGSALTICKTSALLTNGTFLKKDGKNILSCSRAATVALGKAELSFSSNDDFTVTIENDNPYLDNLSEAVLRDTKGREMSPGIGVKRETNGTASSFDCQKGNYIFLEQDKGVVSPFELKVENFTVLNNRNGRAVVCWDEKQGREYDIRIGNNIVEDVTSPYYFDMNSDAVSISVREKFDDIVGSGSWSDEFVYASAYENRLAGNVNYSEGDNKITAKTVSVDGLGSRSMFLCVYNKDRMTKCIEAKQEGIYLTAETEKPLATEKVCTYIVDEEMTPVVSSALYGNDLTTLNGIYADGVLLDGFSDDKNAYDVYFKNEQEIFPVLHALPADGSTKTKISYDFKNYKAWIKVISPSGKTRTIDINFKNNTDAGAHFIKYANTDSDFVLDNSIDADINGKQSMISKISVGQLKHTVKDGEKVQKCYVYTNFKSHENGLSGSRMYSDRSPNGGNRLEMEIVPEFAKGSDYFVFPYGNYYNAYYGSGEENKSAELNFELVEDAEVNVISVRRRYNLKQAGFAEDSTFAQGRYLGKISPEDKYFNVMFNGKSEDFITKDFWPQGYDELESWINVMPLDGYDMGNADDTYQKYLDEQPSKIMFDSVGNLTSIIVRSGMRFNYLYRKHFDAGEIRLDLSEMKNADDAVIVIVKKNTPDSF